MAEGTTDTIIAWALSEPEIQLILADSPQASADRVIARDFTIRFANRRWQTPEQEAHGLRPGTKVVIEQRLNGEIRFRTGDRYFAVLSLPRPQGAPAARAPEHRKPSKVLTLRPASPRPSRESPTTPVPTRPSQAEPGIRTGPPAIAMGTVVLATTAVATFGWRVLRQETDELRRGESGGSRQDR